MQTLVYLFIALSGFAVSAVAYFGLTFTIIEAALAGVIGGIIALVGFERNLRRRSDARLGAAIDNLARLLSTDARAGQVLSQRLNDLTRIDPSKRIADLEADLSVLGTIVQQIAEATAEVETSQQKLETYMRKGEKPPEAEDGPQPIKKNDSLLSVHDVQKAISEDRLEYHVQKIIGLPKRDVKAYDLTAVMQNESGDFVSATDVAPGRGAGGLLQAIERMTFKEAFKWAKQAAAAEIEVVLHTRLSTATLADPNLADEIVELLDTSRSASKKISLTFTEGDWKSLNAMERSALSAIVGKGVAISIDTPSSLRLNFSELSELGVTSVRADASRFINSPETYTDFHASDVADYILRYDIELIATGVRSEQQVLSLLEDGVRFASGNHIALRGVIPSDMLLMSAEATGERNADRRTEKVRAQS